MTGIANDPLFTTNLVGTAGHEILYDGQVVGWAINEGTADMIVDCLNMTVVVVKEDREED